MRVLLVYANEEGTLLPAPPIGLSYVASATARAGHEVKFYDFQDLKQPIEGFKKLIRSFSPEVVGISMRNLDSAVLLQPNSRLNGLRDELIPAIRSLSQAKVVLGGPAVSIGQKPLLDIVDADFAVVGEGENVFPALLECLRTGNPALPVGVVAKHGANGEVCPVRLPAFNGSGMEKWVDWSRYERRGGTWAIQTKRGCPFRCSYCTYPNIEGKSWRLREPMEIVDELERVAREVGPRCFEIIDSTFSVPQDHALAVCEEIVRRRLRINLTAIGVNPRGATKELFTAMKAAGFRSFMITPEAAHPTTLKTLNKGFDMDDVERAAELCRTCGMSSAWFFLLGGPGETMETVDGTLGFAETRLTWPKALTIVMSGIRILPNTEVARAAIEEGVITADDPLVEPRFYLSPNVTHEGIINRLNDAIRINPQIVHGAEEGASWHERAYHRTLYMLGVPPPFWRTTPYFLRFPLIRHYRSSPNWAKTLLGKKK